MTQRWPSYWGNDSVALWRKIEFHIQHVTSFFFSIFLPSSKIREKSPVTGPRRVGAKSEGHPLNNNPWIKKAKKMLRCHIDSRSKNWKVIEWSKKVCTGPKFCMESIGRVCVWSVHSTTNQFSNLESCAHPYNFFCLIHIAFWYCLSKIPNILY